MRSNFLVTTGHKKYPRFLLRETDIACGEWCSATAEIEGQELLVVRFLDLKEKQFITNVSTSITGPPRVTKYHGNVTRPMVAYEYLDTSSAIDIHNHFRTGSCGLEDAWLTKNPMHRQAAGIFGKAEESLLTKRFFQKSDIRHSDFKIALANFSESTRRMRGIPEGPSPSSSESIHLPRLLKDNQRYLPRGVLVLPT